jgi:hypothetical protein
VGTPHSWLETDYEIRGGSRHSGKELDRKKRDLGENTRDQGRQTCFSLVLQKTCTGFMDVDSRGVRGLTYNHRGILDLYQHRF